MARKELDAILNAEKRAQEEIERSRQTAKEILSRAESDAERLKAEALERARAEAQEIIGNARKEAVAIEEEARRKADAEIEALNRSALPKIEDAIALVIDRMKKVV